MNSGIPILMISLQIPVLPDTDTDEVLQSIGMQVAQALDAVRQQQSTGDQPEVEEDDAREMFSSETFEPFTENTEQDLLATLGYAPTGNE